MLKWDNNMTLASHFNLMAYYIKGTGQYNT